MGWFPEQRAEDEEFERGAECMERRARRLEAEEEADKEAQHSLDELAELLEQDEDLEVKMLCLECSSIFTGSADHLIGADGCPNCGSEDLEVV